MKKTNAKNKFFRQMQEQSTQNLAYEKHTRLLPKIANLLKKQCGFTLIEIVIVISILTILAATVASRWVGTVINTRAQADLLASDIRYAQSLSMSRYERYRFSISTGSRSYQILNEAGTAVFLPSGNTAMTLGTGISFGTVSNSLLVFGSDGTPYTDTAFPGTKLASDATIQLTSTGNVVTVSVSPDTGRVIVQ
jgi:prepilin-type N-terminal cleavage/methylation domain-containing protein